jgi:hypothetical protein
MTTASNDRSKSSAVLLLDVSYFLSSDARSVGLATTARIFPRTTTAHIPFDPADAIYNHVSSTTSSTAPGEMFASPSTELRAVSSPRSPPP